MFADNATLATHKHTHTPSIVNCHVGNDLFSYMSAATTSQWTGYARMQH